MTLDETIKSEIGSIKYFGEYTIENGWFGRKKMVATFHKVIDCYVVDFDERSQTWCLNSKLSEPFTMTINRYSMKYLPPHVKDIFLGLNK